MIQQLQTTDNVHQHFMIKDRHNDTWKIFSNWFSWFKTTPEFFFASSFESFLKSFQRIYAWRTNIPLVFVMVFLSYPATLVQKYILTSITSFCADIKNYLHPAKDFVISFNGLTIKLLGAFWAIFYRSHAIPKKYLYLKIVLSVCDRYYLLTSKKRKNTRICK